MPLVRVSLRRGKSTAYRRALQEGVYQALRATFNVPEDDRFMLLTEHDETDFDFGRHYLDIQRSDDLVIIQITVSDTRAVAQKQALYRDIAARLTKDPGLRAEDIFINLIEVKPENWSFGHGIAQYAAS